MPRYSFRAYSRLGRKEKGEVGAASELEALQEIARRGLTPIHISAGSHSVSWWARDISFTGRERRLTLSQQLAFFEVFSVMLAAKFPLLRALQVCHKQSDDHILKHTIAELADAVSEGQPLHRAMQQSYYQFPEYQVSTMKVSETANSMEEIASQIAAGLKREEALKREVRSALVYPAILISMSILVFLLLVFYLAPTLVPIFQSAQIDVPVALQLFLVAKKALSQFWPILILTSILIFTVFRAFGGSIKKKVSPLRFKLPFIGTHMRQTQTVNLLQILAIMLSSGSTLTEAIAVARSATKDEIYASFLQRIEEKVLAGGTLSDTVSNNPLIDPTTASLIQSGEESDQLPSMMSSAIDNLDMHLKQHTLQMTQLVTPVLTLIIGLGVGALILSTIGAIMKLNDISV